jgi:16S rRNA processing protein RimM
VTIDRILVARFGAPHGVRGEVRLISFTQDPAAVADYGPLWQADGSRSFTVANLRPVRDNLFVARVKGIDDRNASEALRNLDLYVDRDRLPPPDDDEFYHTDLIGLAVVLDTGKPVGVVADVLNYGAGDILEIRPTHGDTWLLPFTAATVPTVDIAAGRLTILLPAEVEAREDDPSAPKQSD